LDESGKRTTEDARGAEQESGRKKKKLFASTFSKEFIQVLHDICDRTLTARVPASQTNDPQRLHRFSLIPLRPSRPLWFASFKDQPN
jgi:hypothetical protein